MVLPKIKHQLRGKYDMETDKNSWKTLTRCYGTSWSDHWREGTKWYFVSWVRNYNPLLVGTDLLFQMLVSKSRELRLSRNWNMSFKRKNYIAKLGWLNLWTNNPVTSGMRCLELMWRQCNDVSRKIKSTKYLEMKSYLIGKIDWKPRYRHEYGNMGKIIRKLSTTQNITKICHLCFFSKMVSIQLIHGTKLRKDNQLKRSRNTQQIDVSSKYKSHMKEAHGRNFVWVNGSVQNAGTETIHWHTVTKLDVNSLWDHINRV